MVKLFEDCNLCAIHAKRVTISALPRLFSHVSETRLPHCLGCLHLLRALPVALPQCRRTCSWHGAFAGPSTERLHTEGYEFNNGGRDRENTSTTRRGGRACGGGGRATDGAATADLANCMRAVSY